MNPRIRAAATAAAAAIALVILIALVARTCDDDDPAVLVPPTDVPSSTGSGAPSSSSGAPGSTAVTPTASPGGAVIYIVQSGDTLSSISAAFGVSVEALAAANGITDPASLQVGQTLTIPGPDQPVTTPTPASPSGAPTDGATPPGAATSPPTEAPVGEVTLLTPVDKQHALPAAYVPPGVSGLGSDYVAPGYGASLRSDVIGPLQTMLDAAYANGFDVRVVSAYRSYDQQVTTFQYWVDTLGYEEAARVSAVPGHSEHQLGSTVDVGTADLGWDLAEGFGELPAGQWLDAHAHEFGFALSYPAGMEAITGYVYEPWHFRYIGTDAAAQWKASGLTLNQFLTS